MLTCLSQEEIEQARALAEQRYEYWRRAKNTRTYGGRHEERILLGTLGEFAVARLMRRAPNTDVRDHGWDFVVHGYRLDVKAVTDWPPTLKVPPEQERTATCDAYALVRQDRQYERVWEFWGVIGRDKFLELAHTHDVGNGPFKRLWHWQLREGRSFLRWLREEDRRSGRE